MNFICRSRNLWTAMFLLACVSLALVTSCSNPGSLSTSSGKGTPAEAEQFITDAEAKLFDLNIKYSRADWVKSVFITDDTEAVSAEANKQVIAATTEFAEQAKRFDGLELPYDVARKMKLLKLSLVLPAPSNPAEREEITKLTASLEGDYGKGKYCPEGDKGKCLGIDE